MPRDSRGRTQSTCGGGRFARTVGGNAQAKAHEIIFTSGGTEACNLAILGLARAHAHEDGILSRARWSTMLCSMPAKSLKHHEGFDLTILPVDSAGRVDRAWIRPCARRPCLSRSCTPTTRPAPFNRLRNSPRSAVHGGFVSIPTRSILRKVAGAAGGSGSIRNLAGRAQVLRAARCGSIVSPLRYRDLTNCPRGSHENTRRPGRKMWPPSSVWRPPRNSPRISAPPTSLDCVLLRDQLWQAITARFSERRAQRPPGTNIGKYAERQLSRS